MALQPQVFPLSFAQGLETKTDKKQIAAGQLLQLENLTFISPSELTKRNGHTSFGTAKGRYLTVLKNSLVLLAPVANTDLITTAYPLVFSSQANDFVRVNNQSSTANNYTLSSVPIVSTDNFSGIAPHGSLFNGLTLYGVFVPQAAGLNRDNLFLIDVSNNTVIQSLRIVSSVPANEIVYVKVFNNTFFGRLDFMSVDSAGNCRGGSVQQSGSVWSIAYVGPSTFPAVTVVAANTYPQFYVMDIQPLVITAPDTSAYAMVLQNASTSDLTLYILNTGMVILQTITVETGKTYVCNVSLGAAQNNPVAPFNNTLVVARKTTDTFNTGGGIIFTYAKNSNANATLQSTTVLSLTTTQVAAGYDAEEIYLISVDAFAKAYYFIFSKNDVVTNPPIALVATGVSISMSEIGTGLAGRPLSSINAFSANTTMILGHWTTATQPNYTLLARTFFGSSFTGLTLLGRGTINDAVPLGFRTVPDLQYTGALGSFPNTTYYPTLLNPEEGVYEVRLNTFQPQSERISASNISSSNYLGGSLPSSFDGLYVIPTAFVLAPEPPILTTTASGSIAAGTYSYQAIFKYVDVSGNTYRSSPSVALQVVLASPSTTTITVYSYDFQVGDSNLVWNTTIGNYFPYIEVELYRTASLGTTPFKIATLPITSAGSVSYVDNNVDADILGNLQLYTVGGEVENVAPPAYTISTLYNNRLIVIDDNNPLNWWYSKQVIAGFPPEFSDFFVSTIDSRGGNITALSVMDAYLVFFKQSLIYVVTGIGPSPNGTNNDFSFPSVLSTDVGCTNPNSIALLPIGLMFQSAKGIYLLNRNLSTQYIGSPVERYNDLLVVSTVIVPNTTQVRFALEDGSVLVYDYFVNQWSIFTGMGISEQVIFNNEYYAISSLTAQGVVKEVQGLASDLGAAITFKIQTGWLNFGGVQGYQRVREFLLLAESEGADATFKVSLAYNFKDLDLNSTIINVKASDDPAQYRIFPQIQKAESMRITIESGDIESLGLLSLSNMAFELGIKKGPYKISASRSYGTK